MTVLVSGGILESNEEADKFFLPETHRQGLVHSRKAKSDMITALPRLIASYSDVLECCKTSGPKGNTIHTPLLPPCRLEISNTSSIHFISMPTVFFQTITGLS